ncbi:hypothetical protein FJTKL_14629 [Diaporthe vaccinii]|uniref:Cytochrome P450 n=1 Tax=Diaporthe vaccinii TaxID=105482 RepID=A0ABR4E790_9PEZI
MSDEEIGRTAGTGFGAATDTTWGTSRAFVKVSNTTQIFPQHPNSFTCGMLTHLQAMVLYPSALKAAQEEMDRVIGPDRLPTWSDCMQLPYMRAVIEETLRWAPIVFTAVPHPAARADKYGDYTIPAGAIVNANVWVLNNADCEEDESDPRGFDPTRFTPEETLVEQNCIAADSLKRRHFTFGTGRRVCPGVHIAQRGLFVGLSRLVWGFNFAKKRDADGREINIDRDAFNNSLAQQVLEFEREVTPRDEKRAEIMQREWAEA